jgi:drug/metabolite transporter (DMT)-like permease
MMIAVLAALAAAASFGAGSALQHQQAHQSSTASVPPHRALTQLVRRPRWLAGIALAVAAYGWQATALAFGPLALVAPIAATDLVFALALAAWWSRQRLRKRDWFGCGLVVGGVGCFLAASPPSPGRSTASAAGWLAAFTAVTVIAALAAGAGLAVGGTVRAGLLAAAGGVVFGLTAAVTLSFTRLLGDVGLIPALASWEPWTLIALGATGLLLSVAAYQAGSLAASLPVIDTVEPIASVLIGTMVFGEELAGSAGSMVIQFTAAAIAATGIVLLSPSAGKLRAAGGEGTAPHRSTRGATTS